MKKELIKVCCVVTPEVLRGSDGVGRPTVFYFDVKDTDTVTQTISRLWEAWLATVPPEKRADYDDSGALGGVLHMRMLREDYNNITASASAAPLFAAAGL